ncbi:hypothetical protein KP509_12G009300 [Ceratopteris richardii]|uniref:VQ domain-containing protein n=1 Tax=Ceratopteris richardii TaxID=49495 RepID=A0A8T2TM21_CERRI|nr:hypothetical protein KP509_12G009300 [Ceratopteris richardii]
MQAGYGASAPRNPLDNQAPRFQGLAQSDIRDVGDELEKRASAMHQTVEESYGSSRVLPEEEGLSGQNTSIGPEESLESRRALLSCSMGPVRTKKKRKSRASCKAPIRVFPTDASNFMAMVHKLTGISSDITPFHTTYQQAWNPKILPFNQGLPTLDTSTLLLPTSSVHVMNGMRFPGIQALSSQTQHSSAHSDTNKGGQMGQPLTSLDHKSLCRNLNSSSFPCLWESSHTAQKSTGNQQHQISEGFSRQDFPRTDMAVGPSLLPSNTLSRLEMLLADQDKLAPSNTNMLTSSISKEELL